MSKGNVMTNKKKQSKRNESRPKDHYHAHDKALVDLQKVFRSGYGDRTLARKLIKQIMTKSRLSYHEWELIRGIRERQREIINSDIKV